MPPDYNKGWEKPVPTCYYGEVGIHYLLALGALAAATSARSDDRSIADFQASPPGVALAAVPAATIGSPQRALWGTGGLMPERVSLSVEHGVVTRSGSGYRFVFERAPLMEAVEVVGRIFSVPIACSGDAGGDITLGFLARTPIEALAQVAKSAGKSVRRDGSVWLLEAPGQTVLPELRRGELDRTMRARTRAESSDGFAEAKKIP